MAKTSLAKGTDGKVAIDMVVALRGHLAVGDGEYNPVLHLDRDGQHSQCQAAGWRWDLVLCGGERIEVQLRGTTYPTNFHGSTCVKDILKRHPSDAIVSGKLMKSGLFTAGLLRIEDAKICRP